MAEDETGAEGAQEGAEGRPEGAQAAPEGAERPPPPGGGPPPQEGSVDEEELRRRIEEQLRRVRIQDLVLESVVSIANLTARRIAKDDERDLEQARVGIDAIRAMVDLLEPEPAAQVRNALSELQVLYAKHARGGEEGEPAPAGAEEEPLPPTRRDSGLWTPPGTT